MIKFLRTCLFLASKWIVKKAEEQYGEAMYDRFPVPDEIQELSMSYIKSWNISAAPFECLASTGMLGTVVLKKNKFQASKQQLSLEFLIQGEKNDVAIACDAHTIPSPDDVKG